MSPKAAAFLLGLLIATTGAQDSPSPQQLTDLIGQYFTQLSNNAKETLRQAQQLDISQFRDQIQDHLQTINPYTEEMQKKLILYITQISEEVEKLNEKFKIELEQLQADITPFAVDVQNQVTTAAENLKAQLTPYTEQLRATTDHVATQISQKLAYSLQELQAQVKENVGDPATLSPYIQRLQETVNQQVADIKVQLGPFPAELKAKADQAVEELYKRLSPYAQTTPEQLRRQLEELSFQVEKSAEAFRDKLQGEAEQLRGRLDTLLQGDLVSHLDSLKRDVGQQIEEFRQQAGSYGDSFNQLVVEKMQKLGERLQPHASGVEDHLSFLEKEVKEKFVAFTDSLRQTEERLLPALEEA
ncbi:apolipoprotein A-IV [Pantherophis guttatus]|uniref:Apolipoprotein A-IV n=1 Tax=Pantherophis guttatus TaxID=94885 RepID=A0A6P9CPV5_PANGU|nr:apolipoprotein A-IV [Pantherophis guttatus]XP_034281112.1 apolipoprotein A-IV [Pantherophis guttatus]